MRPLIQTTELKPPSADLVKEWMITLGIDEAEARRRIDEEASRCEYWVNDIYQVEVTRSPDGRSVQINIRRRDGNVIFRDWRHFQEIKNQIVGPECEAIELYPAESRLVDTSNKYHLWCIADPTYRFPLGWDKRDVVEDRGGSSAGLRQRPIPRRCS